MRNILVNNTSTIVSSTCKKDENNESIIVKNEKANPQ